MMQIILRKELMFGKIEIYFKIIKMTNKNKIKDILHNMVIVVALNNNKMKNNIVINVINIYILEKLLIMY